MNSMMISSRMKTMMMLKRKKEAPKTKEEK